MSAVRQLKNADAPLNAVIDGVDGGDLVLFNLLRDWAQGESLPMYLVGGPVRDALLGAPVKDLDFVLEGDATVLARRLAGATGGDVVTHARFGTATVTLPGARVDFVTARRENYPRPGALPEVSPGSISADLDRRDFTINALALPLWEASPEILDHHGGREDLERGIIRTLHGNSFADDPTRIFRAIRYERRLGFSIHGETLAEMKDALERGCVASVTADRVRHELQRILEEADPAPALRRALQVGLLAAIQPSARPERNLWSRADHIEAFGASSEALDRLVCRAPADFLAGEPLCYLAALVYRISPPQAESLIHRLNMPNSWAGVVRDTIALREMELAVADPASSASQVSAHLDGRSPASLGAVAAISDSPEAARRLRSYLDDWRFRSSMLTGDDLLALGVPAGPMVGFILRELRRRRIDSKVTDVAEERQLVADILKNPDDRQLLEPGRSD